MAGSSKLLIDEAPLQVLPSLTKVLDINKAIILQQVHYWLKDSKHIEGGHTWIWNSYTDWEPQFPWLKARTIQYHVLGLQKRGLLIAGEFNRDRRDNTKWYRIDYDALDDLLATIPNSGSATDSQPTQVFGMASSATDSQPLPETTTETTPIEHKKEYGEFQNVRLTDEEHQKLVDRFGDVDERIEKLSAYKKSKGKSYRSDYATILNWARGDGNHSTKAEGVIIVGDR